MKTNTRLTTEACSVAMLWASPQVVAFLHWLVKELLVHLEHRGASASDELAAMAALAGDESGSPKEWYE